MLRRSPWLGQVALAGRHHSTFLSGQRYRLGAGAIALTDATFNQALSAPKAIVDMWSPDCPVCVQFKPVFEDIASSPPAGAQMFTASVNDAPGAFGTYKIQMLPTVLFFQNGKEVHRMEGGTDKQSFLMEVAQAFGGGGGGAKGSPSLPPGVTQGPVTIVESGGGSTWMALGGLGAAGLMAWMILSQK